MTDYDWEMHWLGPRPDQAKKTFSLMTGRVLKKVTVDELGIKFHFGPKLGDQGMVYLVSGPRVSGGIPK